MPFLFQRLVVFGPGLLGGSICMAARQNRVAKNIAVWARDANKAASVLRLGAADEAGTDPGMLASGADLLVLCTPIGAMETLVRRFINDLPRQAIVTDVGSVKGPVVEILTPLLRDHARFIGSHPMAGSEQQGLEAASANLFAGATTILTPTVESDPEALRLLRSFWTRCGSYVTEMNPAEHDRLIGHLSHLPHAVASILMRAVENVTDTPGAFCGNGFLDTTRIAAGPPAMWAEIFLQNREIMLQALEETKKHLDAFHSHLSASDSEALEKFLALAAERRTKVVRESSTPQAAPSLPS